jgi:chromosome segregation ATPase
MVSGVISSSLIFKSTSSVVSIENGNEKQKIDSIITREDKELSRLGDHTSQFDIQNNKADANASQTEIALDDLYLRIERLETDNSYLKSKLKSSISEYEKIKKRYHMIESNYTKTLENNSDLEELVTYYQERIAIQNGSTLILKNKLSESISPPYTFIREREIF